MRLLIPALAALAAAGHTLPPGYWTLERARPLLETTQTLRLAPDLSTLSPGERRVVDRLLEVGALFQRLYEDSLHPQALASAAALARWHARGVAPERTQALLTLYRLNQGPIAATLENERLPFLPVAPPAPGRNVYPNGATREEIEAFLAHSPAERARFLHPRTVIRRATADNVRRDLAALVRHPALDTLHPGLQAGLRARLAAGRGRDGGGLYAVPYAVAWADELTRAHLLLTEAAEAAQPEDADLARYLRHRARDLLTNDYEAGDASWVTGRFRRLNAQVGAYEPYDDELLGVKAFFAVSVLLRARPGPELSGASALPLQELEDALPYERRKRVRDEIPIGVYDVIADFGQARGTNTATILPNEAHLAQRYGRTILLRANVLLSPELFAVNAAGWRAAVAPPFAGHLALEGDFHRTLWHEIGHYLGPDRDRAGRDLDAALQEDAATLEEMKADLVALFAAPALRARGHFDEARLRAVYAAGIRRTLQNVRPRRDQAYQTMQLAQMNYFLEHGLLSWDAGAGALVIRYERYPEVVAALLREVLALQDAGDKAGSAAFIERWTGWRADLHEVLAAKMRAAQSHRFRLVRYAALGE